MSSNGVWNRAWRSARSGTRSSGASTSLLRVNVDTTDSAPYFSSVSATSGDDEITAYFSEGMDCWTLQAGDFTARMVVAGVSYLSLVLGELVPKSLALQYPTKIALWTVVPMQWSLRVYAWLILVLNGSGNLALRAMGVQPVGHRHEAEIEQACRTPVRMPVKSPPDVIERAAVVTNVNRAGNFSR